MLFISVVLFAAQAAALFVNGTFYVSFGHDSHLTERKNVTIWATPTPTTLMTPVSEIPTISAMATAITTNRMTANTTSKLARPSRFLKSRDQPDYLKYLKPGERVEESDQPHVVLEPNLLAYCQASYEFFWWRVQVGFWEKGDPYGRLPIFNRLLEDLCGHVTHWAVFDDAQGKPWVKFHLPMWIEHRCVENIITMVGGPKQPLCLYSHGYNP